MASILTHSETAATALIGHRTAYTLAFPSDRDRVTKLLTAITTRRYHLQTQLLTFADEILHRVNGSTS